MTNKSILIIGGMGHFASLHAHKQLIKMFIERGETVPNIVHVGVEVEHFHTKSMQLTIATKARLLLENIHCDVGFIACNTAHIFFDEFQSMTPTPLINMVEVVKPKIENKKIVCSPVAASNKLFGRRQRYISVDNNLEITSMITGVEKGVDPRSFKERLSNLTENKLFVAGCSEISLIAQENNIDCINPIDIVISKILATLE